jgi:penicillin-binding protein-related factor A (putative recombinase)
MVNSTHSKEWDVPDTDGRTFYYFAFATLDGAPVIPTQWLIDITLEYEKEGKSRKEELLEEIAAELRR